MIPAIGSAPIRFVGVGDSKTNSWTSTKYLNWYYERALNAGRGCYQCGTHMAHPGWTTAQIAGAIDADIAAYSGANPTAILINVGTNDVGGFEDADWLADYGYILDALHAEWPGATIYCAQIWRRYQLVICSHMDDDLIPQVLESRPWALLGIDERIVLENGDDGTTLTTDGIHPNAAGYRAWDVAWAALFAG